MGMRLCVKSSGIGRSGWAKLQKLTVGNTYTGYYKGRRDEQYKIKWVITERIYLTPAHYNTELGKMLRKEAAAYPAAFASMQTFVYKARLEVCELGCSYAYFLRTPDNNWCSALSIFNSILDLENE